AYTYSWLPAGGSSAIASNLSAATYTVIVTDANHNSLSATISITQPVSALSAIGSVTANVLCRGGSTGSASVSASGGTLPYTYIWTGGQTNSSATGLSAGT